MLCHGDTFSLSYSNRNIITCQKINKILFSCDTKKLISFFVYDKFFIFRFYISHSQHVDLLRSGPGNKEIFNPSLTDLCYSHSARTAKKGFFLSKFDVCKTSVKDSYFRKVAGLFLANFAKINTVAAIFQRFYLDFKQFSIVRIFPEDFTMADFVNFKISFLSN